MYIDPCVCAYQYRVEDKLQKAGIPWELHLFADTVNSGAADIATIILKVAQKVDAVIVVLARHDKVKSCNVLKVVFMCIAMHYILHQSIASAVCEVSCSQVSHNGVHAAAQARLVWTRLSCKGLRSLTSSCVYCALAHSPSAQVKLKVLPIKGLQNTRGPSCRRAVPAIGELSSVRFQCQISVCPCMGQHVYCSEACGLCCK